MTPIDCIDEEWSQFASHRRLQTDLIDHMTERDRFRFELLEALSADARMALMFAQLDFYWNCEDNVCAAVMRVLYGDMKCLICDNKLIPEFLYSVLALSGIRHVIVCSTLGERHYYQVKHDAWRVY